MSQNMRACPLKTCGWLLLWAGLFSSGCALPPESADNPMNNVIVSRAPMTDPQIQIIGRTESLNDGAVRFGYPGITTRFNFHGQTLWLRARSTSQQSHLEVIVDGDEPQVFQLSDQSQRFVLIDQPSAAQHQVAIIHRGETWHGLVTLEHLEFVGELLDPPPLPQRKILVLGDSVTCGEAIERTADCQKTSSWWNPRLSYGMLMATALDAQVHLVCYGGRGLVRSWNGRTDELNLPDYAELAIADQTAPVVWDHQRYTPDLILSAIGTNDFSAGIPERELYVSTYVALLKRLLELHPQAQVALTEGAILNGEKKATLSGYLQETQRQLRDSRIHLVPSEHYPGDDCDAHPTKAQHAAMADDLIPHLKQLMGW